MPGIPPPKARGMRASAAARALARCGGGGGFGVIGGLWEGADAVSSKVQSAFVLGADGGVKEVPISQAHLGGDMTQD